LEEKFYDEILQLETSGAGDGFLDLEHQALYVDGIVHAVAGVYKTVGLSRSKTKIKREVEIAMHRWDGPDGAKNSLDIDQFIAMFATGGEAPTH